MTLQWQDAGTGSDRGNDQIADSNVDSFWWEIGPYGDLWSITLRRFDRDDQDILETIYPCEKSEYDAKEAAQRHELLRQGALIQEAFEPGDNT